MLKIDHLPIDDIPDNDIENDLSNIQNFYDQFREKKPEVEINKSGSGQTRADVMSSGNATVMSAVNNVVADNIAGDDVGMTGATSANMADTPTTNRGVNDGTKSDVQQYMDFLRANKIIDKNKWELAHPNAKPPRLVKQNVNTRKSKSQSKMRKLPGKHRPASVDHTVILNSTHSNNTNASRAGRRGGKTFQEMIEHLKQQIHSLADITNQTAVPDIELSGNKAALGPVRQAASLKNKARSNFSKVTKTYFVGNSSAMKGLGSSGKRRKMKQRSHVDDVTTAGAVVKSRLLHPVKANIPAPDDDEEGIKIYDADSPELSDNVLANMAADDGVLPSNGHDNDTFHVVDEGKDSFDVATGSDSWITKIHGHREVIAAGCVVMGIGLLLVLAYVIHALVVRRRNKRQKVYRKLDSERDGLLTTNSEFSLFPETSSSEDSDWVDYNRNKSLRW